jgi:hypothetical protein
VTTRLAGGISLILLVIAVFLLTVFHTIDAIDYRNALFVRRAAQEPAMVQGAKLRHQLDAIATQTEKLAASGDAAAKNVLETLRRQGAVFSPHKPEPHSRSR